MFPIERIKIIKSYLSENKKVEVSKLSSLLTVSEVTIRKDLEKLEMEGFLKRTHGGAVLNTDSTTTPLCDTYFPSAPNGKIREIALIAAELIKDSDFIMLTNGPINLEIAKHLGSKNNLTVLTNDLLIALELSAFPHIKVIFLGGDIDYQSKASLGRLASANMNHFYINKLFIEIDGASEQVGFSVTHMEKATLIQDALMKATSKIVVFTSDCYKKNAFFKVGNLQIADTVITNIDVDAAFKNLLYHHDIQLFTSITLLEGSE